MYQEKHRIWFHFISKNNHHVLGVMAYPETFPFAINELTIALNPKYEFEQDVGGIYSKMKNTTELKMRVVQYVHKHRCVSPELNKLNAFICSLEDNEFFYLFPATKNISQINLVRLQQALSLEGCSDDHKKKYIESFDEFFYDFIMQYQIDGKDPIGSNRKIKIGEGLKVNRVCRFCNNEKGDETTFSKEAHAISESLGNKKIILNEECDSCNEFFDENIERDMDTYLKLYSSFFRIKNKKNKVSKIKGENFTFEYVNEKIEGCDQQIDFVLAHTPTNQDVNDSNSAPPKIVDLIFYQKIRNQNIYKSLVKFALSVIDNRDDLTEFHETIKWIRTPSSFKDKLPKIAVLKNYHLFRKEPSLLVYKSKKSIANLPYAVGEFHYTFLTYIFIIPLFNKDEIDFSQQDNFDNFVKFFPQFTRMDGWSFEDFSEYQEKQFVINMKLSQREGS
ncbi:HNH endonuclease [Serratia fonticola]|uniref:HNH endonuclease n=1 Tax=Serratia fonticola TaxID=47917 RepID=UPI0034C6D37C